MGMFLMTRNRLAPAASQTLNVMRAAAALLVLLNHWRGLFFVDYPELNLPGLPAKLLYFISGFGHQSVIIFFVLSGFLVGGSSIRLLTTGRWSWAQYLFARGTRLYAVLLPALLLGLIWDSSGLHLFGDSGVYGGHGPQNVVQLPVASSITPAAFLVNASFLQKIAGPTFGSNGALWSLTYEFWYYIAFPCVLLGLIGATRIWERVAYVVLSSLVFWVMGPVISVYFLIWVMGAALVVLPACSRRASWTLFYAAMLALAAALTWIRYARANEQASDMVLGVICAVLIYGALGAFQGKGSRHVDQVAGHLANCSYTIYLVHTPALVFVSAALAGTRRWDLSPGHVGIAALVLATVFLYSQAVYFVFEANTERLRKFGYAFRHWVRATQSDAGL